jgi:patatin-like phospholipase/acyl hydrolase
MAKYRILSLDGGGIRGVLTAAILARLEANFPGFLSRVDLFAGTSTGGLIALALAHGVKLQTIRDLYEKKGSKVFADSWLDDVLDLGQIVGAQYGNKYLEQELKRILGKTTLAELKKRVLITAFDLDNEAPSERSWKPKLFHNFPGEDSDGALPAYRVGLYTSAAPTYFPSVDGFVDGGVYANNPSMCALAQTQDSRFGATSKLSDVLLLSIGTGNSLTYIQGQRLDWGYAQWAKPLVTLILDGVNRIADYQCQMILAERYYRIQPLLPSNASVPLDAVGQVPALVKFAEEFEFSQAIDWVNQYWMSDDYSIESEEQPIGQLQPAFGAAT